MKLSISELFESFQGEGPSLGMPCWFLRLAGCNLACHFCDTKYSWDGTEKAKPTPVEDLIAELTDKRNTNLVITGGEPLLQGKALAALCAELQFQRWHVEIETNGTLIPPEGLYPDRWNVSPKLCSAGGDVRSRIVPDALDYFAAEESAIFKLVVTEAHFLDDLHEIDDWVSVFKIEPERVYLMPEGVTISDQLWRTKSLARACIERGYRLSPRLHILLYGNTRRV